MRQKQNQCLPDMLLNGTFAHVHSKKGVCVSKQKKHIPQHIDTKYRPTTIDERLPNTFDIAILDVTLPKRYELLNNCRWNSR